MLIRNNWKINAAVMATAFVIGFQATQIRNWWNTTPNMDPVAIPTPFLAEAPRLTAQPLRSVVFLNNVFFDNGSAGHTYPSGSMTSDSAITITSDRSVSTPTLEQLRPMGYEVDANGQLRK